MGTKSNEVKTKPGQQPKDLSISDFLIYAERSVKLGPGSRSEGAAVGVRTPALSEYAPQLCVQNHASAQDLYSPSVCIENYAEVGNVFTNDLSRADDIAIGGRKAFPKNMPALPFASAMGRGDDVLLPRQQNLTLSPGTYGDVVLFFESQLVLEAGEYVFGSLRMDESSQLIASGTVQLSIVGHFWSDTKIQVTPKSSSATAETFLILIAVTDSMNNANDTFGTVPVDRNSSGPGGFAGCPKPFFSDPLAAVIGREAIVHALLAAPQGTVLIQSNAAVTGAIAGFDVELGPNTKVTFEDGFPGVLSGQQGSQILHGYFGVPDPNPYPLVGPVPADTVLSLAIGLPVRDPSGLAAKIKQVSDPLGANFRKFLTQADFTATYGATQADYAALLDWAQNTAGFDVTATYSNNLLICVRATADLVSQALYVNLVYRQRTDGSLYVTVDRDPSLDLAATILEIGGLNSYYSPKALAGQNGTGGGGLYRAADLRCAYLGVGTPNQSLAGRGQVVGIVGWVDFNQPDVNQYAGLQVPAPGQPAFSTGTFPNATVVVQEGGGNQPANSNREANLDVMMVMAMAPFAKILYFQGSSGITGHLDDVFHSMATSTPPLNVGSCSLGFWYSDNVNQALGEMAVTGVTFFTASGDNGDIGTNDPQNDKCVNQTLVGGSILSTNSLLNTPGAIYPSPYFSVDNTWPCSSGGVMNNVPIPDYQVGVNMGTNGGSTQFRNYPDVAFPAQGIEFVFQGATTTGQGTSFAAPLWAGFMALVNEFQSRNGGSGLSGFINPTIYAIGLTSGSANDLYKVCFFDIADGVSNGGCGGGGAGHSSVTGYDLCTGWGTPTGALINQLGSNTPLTPNQPLTLIRFIISTGGADLGGGLHGSGATATVTLKNGGTFSVTLKTASQANWPNGSVNELTFPIPPTDSNGNPVLLTQNVGIAGVVINQVQSNPGWSANNWDIAALQVGLLNPGSPAVCQLNLVGENVLQDGSTGLVRLSLTAGSSGNGPSSPFYATGPGSGC